MQTVFGDATMSFPQSRVSGRIMNLHLLAQRIEKNKVEFREDFSKFPHPLTAGMVHHRRFDLPIYSLL